MIITVLVAGVGLGRMLLRRVFALASRAEPCEKLHATDASPSGAGAGTKVRLVCLGLGERKTCAS